MKLSEARELAESIIMEINSDPVQLLKMGCGAVEVSNNALNELIEYTHISKELNPDLPEREFFVKLLKNIIVEK